jgi:hypothetical protein
MDEMEKIKEENEKLKKKLKKYTNNEKHKVYYENNNEAVKQGAKEYMKKIKETDPERMES